MNTQLLKILKDQKNTRDFLLTQSFAPRHQLEELRDRFDTSFV